MVYAAEQVLKTNPFPGLRPYEEADERLFFGREDQIYELLARLRNLRFLAILGSSGCGKSSLVRAGVLPALRDGFMSERPDGWRIALMRPGNNPLTNLAQALNASSVLGREGPSSELDGSLMRSALNLSGFALVDLLSQADVPADTKLLIVVDQFEELFRFRDESSERALHDETHRFVQLLLTAAGQRESPIYVILTMRSEFLGDCGPYTSLPEAINDGLYLVPRLSREQLRDAIEQPIKLFGGEISNRLVNRVLNDLGEEQDQLPVLQHALMRLWTLGQEAASGCPPNMDIELYENERIGGMKQALSRHVEEIFRERLDENQQRLAEILFRNLTAIADNHELVRDPTRLDKIAMLSNTSVGAVASVIEHFRGEGKSFLMPPTPELLTADKKIDISHESLIRQWEKLREWTRKENPSRRIRKMLSEEAVLWKNNREVSRKEQDFLLTGRRLEVALEWRKTHVEELSHESMAMEREFLTRSEEDRDASIRKQKELEQRAREFQKFKVKLAGYGVAVAALVALMMFRFYLSAEKERQKNYLMSRSASVNRAWQEWKEFAPIRAWKYLESVGEAKEDDWICKFTADAFRGPSTREKMGDVICTINGSAKLGRIAVATRSQLREYQFDDSKEKLINKTLYQSGNSGIEFHEDGVRCVAWLATDDKEPILVSSGNDRRIIIWSSMEHRPLSQGSLPAARTSNGENKIEDLVVTCIATSPQGNGIISGDSQGGVVYWQWNKPEKTLSISGREIGVHGNLGVSAVVFHPNGQHVLSIGLDSTGESSNICVWDLNADNEHNDPIHNEPLKKIGSTLAINSVGDLLATAGPDGAVTLWSVKIGDDKWTIKPEKVLLRHDGAVNALAFVPDKRQLLSTGNDGTIRVWDLDSKDDKTVNPQVLMRHQRAVYGMTAWNSVDKKNLLIASGGFDEELVVGKLSFPDDAPKTADSPNDSHFKSIAISRDGTWGVIGRRSGSDAPELWIKDDVENQQDIKNLDNDSTVFGVAIGGKGDSLIASCTGSGTVRLSKKVKGHELVQIGRTLETRNNEPAYSVAIDPKGEILLCGLKDGSLIAWDVSNPASPKALEPRLPLKKTGYPLNEFGLKQKDPVPSTYSMVFSSNGTSLVTGHSDGTIWLWEHSRYGITKPKYVGRHEEQNEVYSVAFASSKETSIVSATRDGQIRVWDRPDVRFGEPNRKLQEIYDDITIRPILEFPGQNRNTPGQNLDTIGIAIVPPNLDKKSGSLFSYTADGRSHDIVTTLDGETRRQVIPHRESGFAQKR